MCVDGVHSGTVEGRWPAKALQATVMWTIVCVTLWLDPVAGYGMRSLIVLLFLQPDDWLGVSMTASPRVGQRAASNPPVKADAARTGKPVELRLRPYSVEERVFVNIKLVWEVWHNRAPLSSHSTISFQNVSVGRVCLASMDGPCV